MTTLLNSSVLFEQTLDAEQIDAIREAAYTTAHSNCKNTTNNTVAVCRLELTVKKPKGATEPVTSVSVSEARTWGCHNIIRTAWNHGKDAIYSSNQARISKATQGQIAWAEYFTQQSPYADFLWTTPEEYLTKGIVASSDVPSNFMASMCITSRLIGSVKFTDSFFKLVEVGVQPDAAAMFAHWLTIEDKSLFFRRGGDHGTFTSSDYLHPGVMWSWLRRVPAFTTGHKFRDRTSGSTYGGVYALWDGCTRAEVEGVRLELSRKAPDGGLQLWTKLKAYVNAHVVTKSDGPSLNPFTKALAYLEQKKRERERGSSPVLPFDNATTPHVAAFLNDVYSKVTSLDETAFVTYWNQLKKDT